MQTPALLGLLCFSLQTFQPVKLIPGRALLCPLGGCNAQNGKLTLFVRVVVPYTFDRPVNPPLQANSLLPVLLCLSQYRTICFSRSLTALSVVQPLLQYIQTVQDLPLIFFMLFTVVSEVILTEKTLKPPNSN